MGASTEAFSQFCCGAAVAPSDCTFDFWFLLGVKVTDASWLDCGNRLDAEFSANAEISCSDDCVVDLSKKIEGIALISASHLASTFAWHRVNPFRRFDAATFQTRGIAPCA